MLSYVKPKPLQGRLESSVTRAQTPIPPQPWPPLTHPPCLPLCVCLHLYRDAPLERGSISFTWTLLILFVLCLAHHLEAKALIYCFAGFVFWAPSSSGLKGWCRHQTPATTALHPDRQMAERHFAWYRSLVLSLLSRSSINALLPPGFGCDRKKSITNMIFFFEVYHFSLPSEFRNLTKIRPKSFSSMSISLNLMSSLNLQNQDFSLIQLNFSISFYATHFHTLEPLLGRLASLDVPSKTLTFTLDFLLVQFGPVRCSDPPGAQCEPQWWQTTSFIHLLQVWGPWCRAPQLLCFNATVCLHTYCPWSPMFVSLYSCAQCLAGTSQGTCSDFSAWPCFLWLLCIPLNKAFAIFLCRFNEAQFRLQIS